MLDVNVTAENPTAETIEAVGNQKPVKMAVWETPTLEDVSEQVMAQPYIRFT